MEPEPSIISSTHDIDAFIDRAVDLRTLPVILLEAHRLMEAPDTSAQDVATLLTRDPALAGRILKLANSPYYGFRRRIGSLTQAIVILGFQAVKNLMLTAGVIKHFWCKDKTFDYPGFWAHSVATAITAGEIAHLANAPHADQAYIAGLLHDIGKLVVSENLPNVMKSVEELRRGGMSQDEAEREVVGLDHSDIGYRLIASWGLPSTLAEAVRDHHRPQVATPGTATPAHVIQLADILMHALEPKLTGFPAPRPVDGLSDLLGYNERSLARWISSIITALENAQEFFEILGLGPLKLRGRSPTG